MYSKNIMNLLEEKDITEGDRIRLENEEISHEGILLPRSKAGDNDCIVIKLDNGYNIGLEAQKYNIEKISSGKHRKEEEEAEKKIRASFEIDF